MAASIAEKTGIQLPPALLHGELELTYQGAEALLFRGVFPLAASSNGSTDDTASSQTTTGPATSAMTKAEADIKQSLAAIKFRPRKTYRHPALDAKLTRHRILSEARVLTRLRREGVAVPAVYLLDWQQGWLATEWIAGGTVRAVLDAHLPRWLELGKGGEALMEAIGRQVAAMHDKGVVHGDLTTSNLMLRAPWVVSRAAPRLETTDPVSDHGEQDDALEAEGGIEVVIIDFGLAAQSVQVEDRAVDLYVLERAFGSTHPRAEGLFHKVLGAYGRSYKTAGTVLNKYEEVRLRGRKKIMIG